jgi:CheY-like chemotaxis protein
MKKAEAAPVQTFRILLVDDNCNGLLARKSVLEEYGFSVMAFSSPDKALEAFRESSFDLVITDYRMPELTGTDVIRIIRETKPATPIILISGMVDALGLNEKNTGADSVILKSSTELAHLVRAANRLVRSGVPKKPAALQTERGKVRRATS